MVSSGFGVWKGGEKLKALIVIPSNDSETLSPHTYPHTYPHT